MSSTPRAILIAALIALLSAIATAVLPTALEPYQWLALPILILSMLTLVVLFVVQYRRSQRDTNNPSIGLAPPQKSRRRYYLECMVAEWNACDRAATGTGVV